MKTCPPWIALLLVLMVGVSIAPAKEEPDFLSTHTYIAPTSSAEGYYPVCRYRFKPGTFFAIPAYLISTVMKPEKFFNESFNSHSKIALYQEGKIRIWARACPMLTRVWISEDSRYIVGLSNIKVFNPYQLVVFDREGNLLHAQPIFAKGAKFRPEEIEEAFGSLAAEIDFFSFGRLEHEGFVYLNLLGSGYVSGDAETQAEIKRRTVQNPLSPNIRETPQFYVYWFDEENPQLALQEAKGRATLTIADPQGKLLSFPLKKTAP